MLSGVWGSFTSVERHFGAMTLPHSRVDASPIAGGSAGTVEALSARLQSKTPGSRGGRPAEELLASRP